MVVTAPAEGGGPLVTEVLTSFEPVLARVALGDLAAVAVDMPIGLLATGPRACDRQARRLLGPRRASVFPAPPRAALAWRSWSDARGVSRQAFNLLPKIREVDHLLTPALSEVIVEAHPELAFARLAGAPMRHSKRTPAGIAERRGALLGAFGAVVDPVPGAALHDVFDAQALAVTARRLAAGHAELLGGEIDARGLRAVVAW